VILCFAHTVSADSLHVTFLDVGEGEAIYLEQGDRAILIDTGNVITGYRVATFIEQRNVPGLDKIIITHPHEDHMGGVFQVLQDISTKTRYDNGEFIEANGGQNLYRWYSEFFRNGSYSALKTGDRLGWYDVDIHVLNAADNNSGWNDNSLVLKVHYGSTSFLLMGDAGIEVERRLLQSGIDLSADVLKVGHHGAKSGTSMEFLEAVSPRYAIISIDKDNVRGYPDSSTLKNLHEQRIEVLTTYGDGDIALTSDGDTVTRRN